MIRIENFEKIVTYLANGDNIKAVGVIEDEIKKAKELNQSNVVKRLKLLLQVVSATPKNIGGSSASKYRAVESYKSNHSNNLYSIENPSEKLSNVVLSADNLRLLNRFMNEWKRVDELDKHGLNPINRLLLYGAPGTGKTLLANAIANELDFPLVIVYLDELISSYLGNTGKNIREIFTLARDNNVVIFLDEIDTIAKHRADSQDSGELKRVVTVFLQNLDMLPPKSIVIGATNHEDLLDKAIWRRFPLRLQLNIPNLEDTEALIKLFLGDYSDKVDAKFVATLMRGMNGSAIKDLVEDAIKISVLSNEPVSTAELAKSFFMSNVATNRQPQRKHWAAEMYRAAELLHKSGYSLKDVEGISGIPYTTLRGRIA
jgi:AAA+ superfamily predicted ATPase